MHNNYVFSKKDTNIVKGVAILAMVLHHVYATNPGIPIYMADSVNIMWILASSGKVCVSLLTILSGYGLTESYKNRKRSWTFSGFRFFFSHYIQLISMYWCIYFVCYMIIAFQGGCVTYGEGIIGIRNFIIDLLGLGVVFNTPVFIGGWYLTAIITFYTVFPFLIWFVKRTKWISLIITYIPWIYYILSNDINLHTDWWLFYLFSFILGIFMSEYSVLIRLKEKIAGVSGIVFSIILFCVSLILRMIFTLPADPLLAFSIIMLEIFIFSRTKFLSAFLNRCGTHSANIWLLHGVILGIIQTISFAKNIYRYIFVIILCMGISILIEDIKEGLYINQGIKKLRNILELRQ